MRLSHATHISLACLLPLVGAAQSGGASIASTSPATRSAVAQAVRPASSVAATGPVWPIEPRTIAAAGSPAAPPVLKTVRTGRHGSYERLVLEFTGPYGEAKIRYVPVVRADPSDKVVPLTGRSFLEVVIHQAVATWPAPPAPPYAGRSTVTPGYPTVKQVSISGDFEAVLSLGVGVGRTAGFRVTRLKSPDRLVVDIAEPPAWRNWPDNSLATARLVQKAFDQGHQPWRDNPEDVATAYARAVYGWSNPVVTRAPGIDTYRLAQQGSTDHVTVRAVRPFRTTSKNSIVEIADSR